MTIRRRSTRLAETLIPSVVLLLLAGGTGGKSSAGQKASAIQEDVGVSEIAPNVLVFATSAGNVLASVGPEGALLVGTPSAASTERISTILMSRTKSPARYVVIMDEDAAHAEGDAGWGRRGAFVAMHEKALQHMGGNAMGAPQALSPRLVELGVDRPRIAFSDVLAFDLNGDAIHIVHMKPGYSNADVLVHFHKAKVLYWGEVFPGDGYPKIEVTQGGTLSGLLNTLQGWTDSSFRVVPARGEVTDGANLKAFCDMIVKVREKVRRLFEAGRTEDQVVTEHPTADFDARWGHGRVTPEAFVGELYEELREDRRPGSTGK